MTAPVKRCIITIENSEAGVKGLSIAWDPAIPDGPHQLSRVEALAAGAVLGIGKALTGKGGMEIAQALRAFEKGAKPA
jgi:phosphate starvation-inducible protein PhoH